MKDVNDHFLLTKLQEYTEILIHEIRYNTWIEVTNGIGESNAVSHLLTIEA